MATLIGYSVNGLRSFLGFLGGGSVESPPVTPNNLTKRHIERFVSWLKLKYPNGSTAKNYYTSFKSLAIVLADYGFIENNIDDLLPPNPFPNNARNTKDADPLTMGEMQRLLGALKSDLVAIHKGTFLGNGAEAMSVMLLITAARSGINTTPLLEMARDALKPHPFIPNLRLINTIKRRGKGAQNKTIRQTNLLDEFNAIPLDGVAVFNKALEMSEPLVAMASEEIRSHVWLYRSGQRGGENKIVTLTAGTLYVSTKSLCERHALQDDQGNRLHVSLSRLRKTMESRLWKLSGGDILEVSSIMGHSPAVADNHYLKINDEIKVEGATFVGEAFPDKLRGVDITPTPPGGCQDSLYGSRAPKDGITHCSEFIHCLGCPSYAIVGTVEDLYRLFSYQQFLYAEVEYFLTDEWGKWRERQFSYIRLIDEFTSKKFNVALVSQAKTEAERAPHPFWAKKIEFMEKKLSGSYEDQKFECGIESLRCTCCATGHCK
ncbi:site-specific integrase [Marinobacterium weihaiense]|uniref:Site-specific integrase n=1 Tax=Marinobacterium weihaiense TaxID=2851016 RepID=A0ABS6MF84_9GAMM|nr:site-specific integrase [Marinobacterium weihaiense]MBV0934885.1 site-specific integrase [Marinobacterium weihaiense]